MKEKYTTPEMEIIEFEVEDIITLLKEEFEPQGTKVMPISAVSGQGVKELLWHVNSLLADLPDEPVEFEQEFFPDVYQDISGPITVSRSEEEEGVFLVEGPRVERMLGYTNLESEKGFAFFQNFMKENGILEELENLGIEEGDTVRLYNLEFEYYR